MSSIDRGWFNQDVTLHFKPPACKNAEWFWGSEGILDLASKPEIIDIGIQTIATRTNPITAHVLSLPAMRCVASLGITGQGAGLLFVPSVQPEMPLMLARGVINAPMLWGAETAQRRVAEKITDRGLRREVVGLINQVNTGVMPATQYLEKLFGLCGITLGPEFGENSRAYNREFRPLLFAL